MTRARAVGVAVCVAAVGLGTLLGLPADARQEEPLDPDTAAYLSVVATYRHGLADAAVREIRAWDPALLDRVVKTLPERTMGRLRVCKDKPDQIAYSTIEAAVLLQTDAAVAAMRENAFDEAGRYLDQAQGILESMSRQSIVQLREKQADAARLCGEPPPLDAREWYLAVTKLCLRDWTLGFAEPLARRLVELAPDDPEALYAAGMVREAMATNDAQYHLPPPAWRLSDSEWRRAQARYQQALRDLERYREEAARLFERALDRAPGRHDISLRLGWVSVLLGRERAARAVLEAIVTQSGAPSERYLAALFLGRLSQATKRIDEAVSWYERAAGLLPAGHVARIALAHALESKDDMAGSLQSLERAVDPSEPPADDPWLEYPHGDWRAGEALLARLRAMVVQQ